MRGRTSARPGFAIAALAAALLLAPAAPLPAQDAGEASFVVLMGADTFAVERFTRAVDRVQGEMVGQTFGTLAYQATLAPRAGVRAIELRAWGPGASLEEAPVQTVRLTMRGDSAIVEMELPTGPTTQRFGTREGALPYLNPSFALTEQIVMRARALGGERVEVPVFILQGGQTVTATVTWPAPDSAAIAIGVAEVRAEVSPNGQILGGAIPAQNITFSRIAGLHPYAVAAEAPDYSAPAGAPYTAEEVVVRTPAGHTLAGTFTRPAGTHPVPAVVTITGSGAQERDQAIPMLRGYRPFREIADTLSRAGIGVLRLDDRGTGASTGDFATATSADFADDVRAALAYLRGRDDVDAARLGLVGHSEGGIIAPMVAATDTALAGIVVIAAPARTGREIIELQQRWVIERSDVIAEASRDSVLAAAAEEVEALAERMPWIAYFLEYDPLPTAGRVRVPVLILHPEADRQVPADQAEVLAAAFREGGNRDVTVRVLPDLNHLMLRDPDGDPARYTALEDRAVAPEALGALAEWLVARLR